MRKVMPDLLCTCSDVTRLFTRAVTTVSAARAALGDAQDTSHAIPGSMQALCNPSIRVVRAEQERPRPLMGRMAVAVLVVLKLSHINGGWPRNQHWTYWDAGCNG